MIQRGVVWEKPQGGYMKIYVDLAIQGKKVCACCYFSKWRRCICEGMDKSGASAQHCNSELSKFCRNNHNNY